MEDGVLGVDLPLPPASLFERLSQVSPSYIWDESFPPWHSSYDHWHAHGVLRNESNTPLTTTSTSSTFSYRSSTSNRSSPRLSSRPNIAHHWSSISGASTDGSEFSARPDPERMWTPVVARISTHTLRLEREYRTVQQIAKDCDPKHEHTLRPIDMFKLPTIPGAPHTILACVYEAPGMNDLREVLDFGPAFFGKSTRKMSIDSNPGELISLQSFFDFAIGACECLEVLHHGANRIHGELRQDALHWNRETGRVRFTCLGNGPRAFENLLSSNGWAIASKELGVKNKLAFIAPEQTGRLPSEPDSRTDIYSLGVIFWSLLTGRAAFDGDTPIEIIQKVLSARLPTASSIRLDVPDALCHVIQKMTDKQMDRRYNSVSGLKHDLVEIQKLLGEGESAKMATFKIASSDVSSFFILPSRTIGHQAEHDRICRIIEKIHKRHVTNSRKAAQAIVLSNASTSSMSDRGDNQETAEGSDTSSYAGRQSRSNSATLLIDTNSTLNRSHHYTGARGIAEPRNSILDLSDRDSQLSGSMSSLAMDSLGRWNRRHNNNKTNKKTRTEVILLSGIQGCGKSTILRGIQSHMRKFGYYTSAKFDKARPTPFEPMLKAMASLFRQMFSEANVNTSYHEVVRVHVRPLWSVLHSILDLPESLLDAAVPSKKLIFSGNLDVSTTQSSTSLVETPSLQTAGVANQRDANDFLRGPASTKSIRLINTYIDVLRVLSFSKAICICLDDLQFADAESIDLIQNVIKARIPVVLVLAQRVDEGFPRTKHAFLHDHDLVTKIEVPQLKERQVFEYVAATLAQKVEVVIPLAACVYEGSAGNPFMMKMILQDLHDHNCLWYDWRASAWQFNLDKVFDVMSANTSEKGDFVTRKLSDLSPPARCILAWASVIGNTFSWRLIKKLLSGSFLMYNKLAESSPADATCKKRSKFTTEEAVEGLQELLNVGIVVPGETDEDFQFAHTRYLNAANGLRECAKTDAMHFVLAQAMLSYLSQCNFSLYPLARHICLSSKLIKSKVDVRYPYRDTLWKAATKASGSGAKASALEYYQVCVDLLQDDPWDDSKPDVYYDESLQLHVKLAELLVMDNQLDEALVLLDVTFEHARCSADRTRSHLLRSRIHSRQGLFEKAFESLQICLVDLGFTTSDKTWDQLDIDFKKLEFRLRAIDVEGLTAQPISEDKNVVAVGTVLSESLATVYWHNSRLWLWLVLEYITVILDRGLFVQAGLGFVMLGAAAISRYKDPELGAIYCDIAMRLSAQNSDPHTRGRVSTLASMFVQHVTTPMIELLPILENALDLTLSSGDSLVAILNLSCIATVKFWAGQDLAEIEAFCNYAPEEFENWQKDMRGGAVLISIRQLCRALQGKTHIENKHALLDDENCNKREWLEMCKKNKLNWHRSRDMNSAITMPAYYVYGHYDRIIEVGRHMVATSLDDLWSVRAAAMVKFYLAISLMSEAQTLPKQERQSLIDEATVLKRSIEAWASYNDVNYYAWIRLINAQVANSTCDYDIFVREIEDAIDHCQVHGFAFEEALALEMLADFLLARGSKRAGRTVILEAISAYSRISAHGKSAQLAEKHEFLISTATTARSRTVAVQTEAIQLVGNDDSALQTQREYYTSKWLEPTYSNTNGKIEEVPGMGLDILDFTSILEFSKIISSELQITSLLEKMTAIILESVGGQAEFCAIVIDSEDRGWCVAASGDHDQGVKTYPDGITFEEVDDVVAQQITNYIIRSKETIFVSNVLEDERFGNVSDVYLERNPNGRAIIGIPIVQSDHLMGVIHLEGRPHSFTNRNLVVLNLLTTQVAISLGNALLYRKVRKVSAANAAMVESQKRALAAARAAESKALEAEKEAVRNVKLAEEAAKSKSMFLANVSHELRTPLNGVIGMSELLKGTQLTEDQGGYADSIRMCADTLLTVINDILDFSKLEAGKMQIFNVPLNLTETITEVVRALSYQNQERGLQTITDLKLSEGLVLGDPVRVHQVLLNILSNSYKFCSKGSITVRARQLSAKKDTVKIECSVQDTGIGITKEQLSRLFKPFSQADSSTARSYGGSGLGLSICKAIVENVLGGTIWIESEPGVGTTVFFQLTFQRADKDSSVPADMGISAREPDPMANWSQSTNPSREIRKASFCDLSKVPKEELRVCIAEDNAINRKIAISFVAKLGLTCEAYEDGKLAYEALQRKSKEGKPYHLVLMDVQMPVLDGYEATKAIRKDRDPNVNQVLVIAMTASAIRGDREKCLEAGMNDYLAKPVRQAALKSLLDGYLDGTKHAQHLSQNTEESSESNKTSDEGKTVENTDKATNSKTSVNDTNGSNDHKSSQVTKKDEAKEAVSTAEPLPEPQQPLEPAPKPRRKRIPLKGSARNSATNTDTAAPSSTNGTQQDSPSSNHRASSPPSGKKITDALGRLSHDTTENSNGTTAKEEAEEKLSNTRSEQRREKKAEEMTDKTNRD